jgi:hypothetical protein
MNAAEIGLEVPGLPGQAQRRDRLVLEGAQRLLERGYSPLLREVYDLGAPVGEKVRPGFEGIAPRILAAYKGLFAVYQELKAQEIGKFSAAAAQRIGEFRQVYDELRGALKPERFPPGDVLYAPPKPGESASDWFERVMPKTLAPIGGSLALGVGVVIALWLLMRRS